MGLASKTTFILRKILRINGRKRTIKLITGCNGIKPIPGIPSGLSTAYHLAEGIRLKIRTGKF
jgi:hypothetical protein